jgi:hypothetical protein
MLTLEPTFGFAKVIFKLFILSTFVMFIISIVPTVVYHDLCLAKEGVDAEGVSKDLG